MYEEIDYIFHEDLVCRLGSQALRQFDVSDVDHSVNFVRQEVYSVLQVAFDNFLHR